MGRKKKKGQQPKKKVTVVVCSLTKGQEPDEKRQPILWTERPTGAVMGAAGWLWPLIWATMEMSGCNNRRWGWWGWCVEVGKKREYVIEYSVLIFIFGIYVIFRTRYMAWLNPILCMDEKWSISILFMDGK